MDSYILHTATRSIKYMKKCQTCTYIYACIYFYTYIHIHLHTLAYDRWIDIWQRSFEGSHLVMDWCVSTLGIAPATLQSTWPLHHGRQHRVINPNEKSWQKRHQILGTCAMMWGILGWKFVERWVFVENLVNSVFVLRSICIFWVVLYRVVF